MPSTSVVIVTYNSRGVIGPCLESCLAAGLTSVVVVDNRSTDGTAAEVRRFPSVHLIENLVNRGFAAAVNQGAAEIESDFILLLNPDTRLQTPVEALCEAAALAGASCGLLQNADGTPQRGFTFRRLPSMPALAFEVLGLNRLWPSNPVNRNYRCLDADLSVPADVEQPAGAFLMVRRDVWDTLGGMDERFHPVWFEDVDLCFRLRQNGFPIRYLPSVKAFHLGGHSAGRIAWECRQRYWYASLLKYAALHAGPFSFRLLCLAVLVGATPRLSTGIRREGSTVAIALWFEVVRLAGSYMLRRRVVSAVPSVSRQTHRFTKTSTSTRA
jgi:N-acetylglucosaminyl-diphospho-decaprenol L-rhamnosyltransferase